MKVILKSCTGYVGTDHQEEIEVDENITEKELDEIAWENAIQVHGLEGWWEKVEND